MPSMVRLGDDVKERSELVEDLLPLAAGECLMDLPEVLSEACLEDDKVAGVAVKEAVAGIRMILDWDCKCSGKGGSRNYLVLIVNVTLARAVVMRTRRERERQEREKEGGREGGRERKRERDKRG
jgi:hypothetical protein